MGKSEEGKVGRREGGKKSGWGTVILSYLRLGITEHPAAATIVANTRRCQASSHPQLLFLRPAYPIRLAFLRNLMYIQHRNFCCSEVEDCAMWGKAGAIISKINKKNDMMTLIMSKYIRDLEEGDENV